MHHNSTRTSWARISDVGYGILRMSDDQPWEPYFLGNPVYASLLALLFEYGVALHDLEVEDARYGRWDWKRRVPMMQAIWRKVRRQAGKDYSAVPGARRPVLPGRPGRQRDRQRGPQPADLSRSSSAATSRTVSMEFTGRGDRRRDPRRSWYVRQLLGPRT